MARKIRLAGNWIDSQASKVRNSQGARRSQIVPHKVLTDIHALLFMKHYEARKLVRSGLWPTHGKDDRNVRIMLDVLRMLKRNQFAVLMMDCAGHDIREIASSLRMKVSRARKIRDRLLKKLPELSSRLERNVGAMCVVFLIIKHFALEGGG